MSDENDRQPEGQGFARRVTLKNLDDFRRFLGEASQRGASGSGQDSDQQQDSETQKDDSSTNAGEDDSPFDGISISINVPYETASIPSGEEPQRQLISDSVLLAEISKGGRWEQANFHKDIYTGFFGAVLGRQRLVKLRQVDLDDTLHEVENRPTIEVGSGNYRIELKAASDLDYPDPDEDPPVVLFLRVRDGHFLYHLFMPDDDGYSTVSSLLDSHWSGGGRDDLMRQTTISIDELRNQWPDAPILEPEAESVEF